MYWALSGLSIGLSEFKTVSFYLKTKSILNMKKKKRTTFRNLETQLCASKTKFWSTEHTKVKSVAIEYFRILNKCHWILSCTYCSITYFKSANIFDSNLSWSLWLYNKICKSREQRKLKKEIHYGSIYCETLTKSSQESKEGFSVLEFLIQSGILCRVLD